MRFPRAGLAARLRGVFQNRSLTLLWLGQMASQSADTVFQIGLLWLTLELTGSEAVTGLVAMASYLPAVLLALATGVAADRLDRRRIMLASDGLRAAAVLTIPAAHSLGHLDPVLLGATAFVLAIAAAFFNPARDSFIPQIVPPQGLVPANSLIQTSWQSSLLLGPALAGLFMHQFGLIHLFSADALLYLASFACLLLIGGRAGKVRTGSPAPVVRDVVEGVRYAAGHPVLRPLLLLTIADNLFIMGPAIVGTPVFVREVLGLGAGAYALVQGCYAVGMLLGTAGLLGWGSRFGRGKVLLVGMILDGITFAPLFWVDTLAQTAAAVVVHSVSIPLLTVSRAALIGAVVPAHLAGRTFALVNMAVVGMSALSSALTGFALEAWGAPTLFLVISLAGGACGAVGVLWARELWRHS